MERLSASKADRRDPAAPIAAFARRHRSGLEVLGKLGPAGDGAALRVTRSAGVREGDRLRAARVAAQLV